MGKKKKLQAASASPSSQLVERRAAMELKAVELQEKLLESMSAFALDFVDPREPYIDQDGFNYPMGPQAVPGQLDRRGRGDDLPVYLNWTQLKLIRDQMRILCAQNAFAICGQNNRTNFAVGKGFTYEYQHTDPKVEKQGQAYLDDFRANHNWPHQEREILERCDRDGETILRFFPQGEEITTRYVEPEWLGHDASADNASSFGVITDPSDITQVKAYMIAVDPQYPERAESVPAAEIIHIKFNVDSSAKRGRPTFYAVRRHLERADKLLRNMSVLAQVQSTYAVIRKHMGMGAAAITAFRDAQVDATVTNQYSGQTRSIRQLPPGSILDTFGNTEYQFPSATIQADKYVAILQAELRAAAARLGMPEYMLTSDASNANYASTMVAESPAVQSFLHLQWFLAWHFGQGPFSKQRQGVMWKVLLHGVKAQVLPVAVLLGNVCVTPPNLVTRDRPKETSRREVLYKNSILSRDAWAREEEIPPEDMPEEPEILPGDAPVVAPVANGKPSANGAPTPVGGGSKA